VRLTRANFRTGRLEISAYVPVVNFTAFLKSQLWRLRKTGPDKLPLGSFRLQLPGNPNAVNAALCSGRFPGVFTPYPLDHIYPQSDPEKRVLYQCSPTGCMIPGWKEPAQAFDELKQQEGRRPEFRQPVQ
jgi:hypothetical protein